MERFVKLTLIVAAVIVGLLVLVFVVKIVAVAAVIAVLIIGIAFVIRELSARMNSRPPAP